MDEWTIDVVLTAAQKCLGTPPGLSILVLSERAMEKRRSLASVPAYYSDLLRWLPVMHDPTKYFSTPCVNEIRAFYEGTRLIMEEGLEARFARHDLFARAMRAGLAALGFGFFTDPKFLASTLSVVHATLRASTTRPSGRPFTKTASSSPEAWLKLRARSSAWATWGTSTADQVLFALDAVESTLKTLGRAIEPGAGARAAREVLGA